ncbi:MULTISPECIES: DUF6457 domain-containing protein [unclassified Streptomyces]|uniref:DUF6457 domain-containing protein n=1 Tax=unclassified Streptomyces TaxID=2593676 RepID=UPI001CD4286A|nr:MULTISPECIES: DUF6457 domain-containing protein [unclassified Streptomyces]
MNPLERWIARVAGELGVSRDALDRDGVLDVAKNVAHQVARPAAPLTTYLLGVAVGRGIAPATAAETVNKLAAAWPVPSGGEPPAPSQPGRGT